MVEADATRALLEDLKGEPWKTIKLSDRFTKGVPDLVSIRGFRSAWWEAKCLRERRQSLEFPATWCDNQVQLLTLVRARGFYWVTDPRWPRRRSMVAWADNVQHSVVHGVPMPVGTFRVEEGDGHGLVRLVLAKILMGGEHDREFDLRGV